jgi:hypothetical protein
MTQLTNDYIYEISGSQGFFFGDDIFIGAGAGTTISNGIALKGQAHRIVNNGVNVTANASLQLKSILSNDNPQLVIVINDSNQAVVVFPFKAVAGGAADTAENINGAQTGFSIAATTSAVFWSSLVQTKRKGGSGGANSLNWSAATFS